MPDDPTPEPECRPGRPALDRFPGSLMPVYKLLQVLMPHIPASRSQTDLAFALGAKLGNTNLTVPNMLRELGGNGTSAGGIHPKYFAAFKKVYSLDALGITDDVLHLRVDETRETAIRALIEQRCFDWLWAQRTVEQRLTFDDPTSRLGPNGNRFQRLPPMVANRVPVGTEFRFAIDMPWSGYVTILSQDPTELKVDLAMLPGQSVIQRPTFCLDHFAGVPDRPLPQGRSVLPGLLTMDPPLGLTRTILVASQRPIPVPWSRPPTSELDAKQSTSFLCSLIPIPIAVFCLEYHVVEYSDISRGVDNF